MKTDEQLQEQFGKWIDEKQYGLGWQDGRGTWEEFLSATWAGYQAGSRSRDAEVQALREALEQANARLRVLAGDIHSVWLRDIDVALTGGRQALPTTADVIGILREEGTDDE